MYGLMELKMSISQTDLLHYLSIFVNYMSDRLKSVYIKYLLLLAILSSGTGLYSQSYTSSIKFDSEKWDFGTIREADGVVAHTFSYENIGDRPIVTERVQPDCGCTTPRYKREPVKPGAKGDITIEFDPADYSGKVTKGINVYSDGGKNRIVLTVTANVIGRPRTIDETYPLSLGGGLKANILYRTFEYVGNGTSKSMTVEFINTSKEPVKLSASADGSGYLEVFVPGSVASGEVISATFTYNLTGPTPVYGILTDRVFLTINGKKSDLPISCTAIAVDDFSYLDRSEAPVCSIEPAIYNFGTVKQGKDLSAKITITNKGNDPLIIRNVDSRRNARCDLKSGTVIEAGREIIFNAGMTAEGIYGIATSSIVLIVNDPERPMREIKLAAEIKN